MLARMWFGRAPQATADRYATHVTETVVPSLRLIDGHRGAMILRRDVDDHVEFAVITLWDSIEAVRRFAGTDVDHAVVEPAAQAVLSDYDETVRHFEIISEWRPPSGKAG